MGTGHLIIIGGGEDRTDDKNVLTRFVEMAGGAERRFVVITTASRVPDKVWEMYDAAFGDLGVDARTHLHLDTRADANNPDLVAEIEQADGIFMTGGDQKRLLAIIGGTLADHAMHRALIERGAVIAGTSAGASAMSAHMLADGKTNLHPEKGAVHLGAGLGLVNRVVIDQHFSQRHRLSRLLTVIAANPHLLGVGIDEDTALIVTPGSSIEVIGDGAVTIVDGRDTITNIADLPQHGCPELIDVRLHLLPSGSRYKTSEAPAPLQHFMHVITQRNTLS
ncbi:cyanophycinase [Duganella sp. Leaf126]|uniref:cyanophycinase n=1 Tax=Duganella sp. Leaf126 TaxID=1736266 RepID=UPI0006F337EC|nr:cyanophycinase [Duganella sp. Leaf126]KQQ36241.1 cyanophycinase [Duganella sp. Leaf126]